MQARALGTKPGVGSRAQPILGIGKPDDRDPAPVSVRPRPVLNPLRSEQEAFRFLLYVAAVFIAITVVVLVVRALT